jgi:hypothetical protein
MPYDYDWANKYLTEYHTSLTDYFNRRNDGEEEVGDLSMLKSSLIANQGPVRRIAEDVLNEPVPRFGAPFNESDDYEHHRLVSEALVLLRKKRDIEQHWSPDVTIDIEAEALHPWVWNAAEDLWASGHWGEALEAALKVVNAKLQDKTNRRDVSEVDLVNRAWSRDAPKPREPRLRTGDPGDPQTYRSLNEGALALGQALFKLWRNPLAHLTDKMRREQALEGLAAASAFARLVDEATVEQPADSIDDED